MVHDDCAARLIRKLDALTNWFTEALRARADGELIWRFDPLDAVPWFTSIVRAAKRAITVVDGYVSDHTLGLLGVKAEAVAARVLTRSTNPTLVTAARAFNAQYGAGPPLEIRTTTAFHDRFIVVDDADFYHFQGRVGSEGTGFHGASSAG